MRSRKNRKQVQSTEHICYRYITNATEKKMLHPYGHSHEQRNIFNRKTLEHEGLLNKLRLNHHLRLRITD